MAWTPFAGFCFFTPVQLSGKEIAPDPLSAGSLSALLLMGRVAVSCHRDWPRGLCEDAPRGQSTRKGKTNDYELMKNVSSNVDQRDGNAVSTTMKHCPLLSNEKAF